MKQATLIMAYYENPMMLREQLAHMRRFSKEVRKWLRVIVVDDGSPNSPAEYGDAGCSLTIYRIGVDIRWNQDAARNIGAYHSETQWLLLTDMDHMVPETTWQYLLAADLKPNAAYKFARVSAPGMEPYKPHPNSYFMTRDTWDRSGGYDERFAGYYGTDGDYRDRINAVAPVIVLPQPIIRVPREHIADASTTTYARKSPEDKRLREIKNARSQIAGWRPKTLTFPFTRVTNPGRNDADVG